MVSNVFEPLMFYCISKMVYLSNMKQGYFDVSCLFVINVEPHPNLENVNSSWKTERADIKKYKTSYAKKQIGIPTRSIKTKFSYKCKS